MKIGIRRPSLKRSIKARTTGRIKRSVKKAIPRYGKKGMGWIKNPKKAAYNKVYHKTTVGVLPSVMGAEKTSKKRTIANTSNSSENRAVIQANNYTEKKNTKRKTWLLIVAILCLIGGIMNIGNSTGAAILGIVLGLGFGVWWVFSNKKRVDRLQIEQASMSSASENEEATLGVNDKESLS